MTQDRPQDSLDRVTVAEAADRIGLTQDAVRKRVACGTIQHDKDQDGRIYVYVSPSDKSSKTDQNTIQDEPEQDRYIASLEDQIGFLRRELERKDAILLRMAERIPELEPAQEPQRGAETHGDPGRADTPAATSRPAEGGSGPLWHGADAAPEDTLRRPWWQRWFRGRR